MTPVAGRPATRKGQLAGTRGRKYVIEQRTLPPAGLRLVILVLSVAGALATGGILLSATGHEPWFVYRTIYRSSFGSWFAFSQTLGIITPLLLTSLAAAIAFRVRLYSVGADGQFLIGAICGSGLALAMGDRGGGLATVSISLFAAMIGGAAWAGVAACAFTFRNTSVILSTLMLNFVALNIVSYLVLGSSSFWRDSSSIGQPLGKAVPEAAQLPPLFFQADVGILIAIVAALGVWLLHQRTRWGYEVQLMGDSPRSAAYAGINVRVKIVAVLCLSGALAGLAGGIQVTNVTEALQPQSLNPGLGFGYSGIVVAALCRLNLLATIPTALLVGSLLSAGPGLELVGVPSAVVAVLQGVVLFLVTGGQFFLTYRIRRNVSGGKSL